MKGPHISIKGEQIFDLMGFPITNTIMTTVVVLIFFFFLAKYYYNQINKKERSVFFYGLHSVIMMVYDLVESVLHKKTSYFFPLLGSFFFFILIMNWSGLFPGVGSILIEPQVHHEETVEVKEMGVAEEVVYEDEHGNIDDIVVEENKDINSLKDEEDADKTLAEEHTEEDVSHESHKIPLFRGGTADLNTTIALGMITVLITQFFGFKFLGFKEHMGKYFNFVKDPMLIMLGPLELFLEFARIVSFAFRLYGNIFAGEVLLTVIPFLLPMLLSFIVSPMFFLEIFVGIVQSLVFVMLSAVFMNMAVSKQH